MSVELDEARRFCEQAGYLVITQEQVDTLIGFGEYLQGQKAQLRPQVHPEAKLTAMVPIPDLREACIALYLAADDLHKCGESTLAVRCEKAAQLIGQYVAKVWDVFGSRGSVPKGGPA